MDFSQLADLKVDSIPEPKPTPPGMYYGEIAGEPEWRESKEKKTPSIYFRIALKEATDDVDADALEEYGGLLRSDGEAKQVEKHYYYSAKNGHFGFDFRQLCESLGLEGSVGECMSQMAGAEVQFLIKHEMYNGRTKAVVERVMAREEE